MLSVAFSDARVSSSQRADSHTHKKSQLGEKNNAWELFKSKTEKNSLIGWTLHLFLLLVLNTVHGQRRHQVFA